MSRAMLQIHALVQTYHIIIPATVPAIVMLATAAQADKRVQAEENLGQVGGMHGIFMIGCSCPTSTSNDTHCRADP